MEFQSRASRLVIIAAGLVSVIAVFAAGANLFQNNSLTIQQQTASAETESESEIAIEDETKTIETESEPKESTVGLEQPKLPNSVLSTSPKISSIDITKLPLGTNKFTGSPKIGYVYSCQRTFNGGGATKVGPWVDEAAGVWDLTKKVQVDGSKVWAKHAFTTEFSNALRLITTNGLPSHVTGVFPIRSSDDAYKYDHNPNSIKTNNLTISLQTDPVLLAQPECVGGEVGILLSGVPIFSAFDAAGRDAVAMEVQDQCNGHPQHSGLYHYHGPSDCIADSGTGHHSKLMGYAFDGFGIYGVKGEGGTVLSSKDLDDCHGHTHKVDWNGTQKEIYHYHLTYDFPYSVACFRARKTVTQPLGGQTTNTQPAPVFTPDNLFPH